MRDYWLNRFFYEMQQPAVRARYAADPEGVMQEYRLSPEARRAVQARDIAFLAPRTNPYLLRYYCGYIGMTDLEFIAAVRATAPTKGSGARG